MKMRNNSVQSTKDSAVVIILKLVQWKIERIDPNIIYRSNAFKIGIWNWFLDVEKNEYLSIRLYPKSCCISKEQPPVAEFVIRVSIPGRNCVIYSSPVQGKLFGSGEDFVWHFDCSIDGHFMVEVEFLKLKASSLAGGEPCPIWLCEEILKDISSKYIAQAHSRMLEDNIYADVIIKTSGGDLKAHKVFLASSSPVLDNIFLHNKKKICTIKMEDMSLESCLALLKCMYGTIEREDFLTHRSSLISAANKYDISKLKNLCEHSLIEDFNSNNVLNSLREARQYRMHKLKKACFTYLFDFGKAYALKEEMQTLFQADRELLQEVKEEMQTLFQADRELLQEVGEEASKF